ncbi:hypothetical protein NQ314_009385 [Rhamnusium bicolor]|uniref:Uncharacterized protein n=1 Tax=Rhamnusium bicolor TaxID=1586634 RepID=A0AAV8Y194_9CUCU|nr:hypothetical protein NQ314_009385 [Rhamnusium bicolor]
MFKFNYFVDKESATSTDTQLDTTQDEIKNDSTISPPKRCLPKNTIFQPGGASYTLQNREKSHNTSTTKIHTSTQKSIKPLDIMQMSTQMKTLVTAKLKRLLIKV